MMSANHAHTVAFDARAISHPQPGGFKTYSENLIRHLPELQTGAGYLVLFDRPFSYAPLLNRADMQTQVVKNGPAFLGVPYRENFSLPACLKANQIELAHFPNGSAPVVNAYPFIVTIHDTIELMAVSNQFGAGSLKRNLMHLYNRYNQVLAARHAQAIITVSNSSRNDIIRYLKVPEEKIFVTYEGPTEAFLLPKDPKKIEEILHKYGISKKYILAIGSADPRKNLRCLIHAYNQLPADLKAQYELVLVMTHQRLLDTFTTLVEQYGLTQRVKFLKSVSNEDLAVLYQGTSVFAFPSLYEGFGLPPLEAMACGAPVIAAKNSSIPEITGEAAYLVDGIQGERQFEGLAEALNNVLSNANLRETLSQCGIERAGKFTWERCAEETVRIYHHVLSNSHNQKDRGS
jgi:glycosyltransferase involved in cell wall biosynthesis